MIKLALALVLAVLPTVASGQFVGVSPRRNDAEPRVFLMRTENLTDARQRVLAGDRRLQAAYAALDQQAKAAMRVGPFAVTDKRRTAPSGDKHDYVSLGPYWWPDSTKPGGLPYVQRDGQVNPENRLDSDSPHFLKFVDAVETLALAGWFTRNDDYTRRAALLIRTWFLAPATRMNPNLLYAQGIPGITDGRGIGIIDTRDIARVIDAIGLVATTPYWTDRDEREMQAWCKSFLTWLTTHPYGIDERDAANNHGVWYDAQIAALALYVRDVPLAQRTIAQSAAQRFTAQVRPDGEMPLETARTRPLHYTLFTLEPFERLAELGRHVGVDFWRWQSPSGATLLGAAQWVARYADATVARPKADVMPVAPDEFLLPLRRAVQVFGDPVTAAAIGKLPADVVEADRSRLLYPDVP